MADRRMWWGVGVLTMGIGAALLTGSATASADTGSDSGSTHSSSSATDHDTTKADSGADNDSSPRHSPKTTTADSTTGATSSGVTSTESGSSTTRADQDASESTSTAATTKADKPSGAKRQHNPQRVVQLRITKPDTEATPAATDADQPSTTTSTVSEAASEPSSTTPAVSTDEPSTPVSPQMATSSSTDPTALPRGPTTLRSLAVVVDAPTTSTTVEEQSTTDDPAVTEPTTAPVEVEPVAALVTIDPVADPVAPTMRLAAMQPLAAPQLFSAAAPTLTTPFVPTVIQAPPTVGPIATAVLDILASLGWRASPLAVAVFPSLYPWSAGAAVPTPVDAVYTPSGTPPTTAPYVLVGHSTLDIPCGPTTYSARVDWYFPAQDAAGTVDPQGMIWVQNGFLANSGFYTALATNLSANTNSIVVVPTITSNPFSCFGCWLNGPSMQAGAASLFTGNRQALLDSAVAAGYVGAGLPDPFILSGHSAGGGFAAATAGYFINNPQANIPDLKGVVMFDGVPGIGVLSSVAPQLRANNIPIYQIAAQNQIWNVWGSGTNELVATNPGGFNGVVIYHGSHVDSMLGGNPIVDFFAQLVTQFSPPGATQAVYTYADGWINDMYSGAPPVGPLYPAPNQPVQIGPALTYGLPSPTGQRSRLGELIYGIITFFSSLFGA